MSKFGGIGLGAGAAAVLAALAIVAAVMSRDPGRATDLIAPVAAVPDDAPPAATPNDVIFAEKMEETAPTANGVSSVEPPNTPVPPDFDVVRVDPAGSALVAGRASPDVDVTLRINGDPVATVKADAQGNFVSFFEVPGSDAPQVLSLEAPGADGLIQKAPDTVIVAPTFPSAPALASGPEVAAPPPATEALEAERVEPDQAPEVAEAPVERLDPPGQSDGAQVPAQVAATPSSPRTPRLLRTGPDGLAILQTEERVPDARTDLGIDAITYNAQGDVQLAGRAGDAAELRIYLDNRPIGDVQADPTGAWASQLPDIPPGVYTLRVDVVRADGGVSSRIETPFERAEPDLAAALAGNAEAITVQPGFTLWAISESFFGEGIQYVQIFEANRDLIRDPDLIYPGQVFALPDPG